MNEQPEPVFSYDRFEYEAVIRCILPNLPRTLIQ